MSAFGGKADMTLCGNPLSRSLLGVKRTWRFALAFSSFESGFFTAQYTSTAPPNSTSQFLYNITGPGETLSDTLSITVAPTTTNGNTTVSVSFNSDNEGGAALTPLACTASIISCTLSSIAETGASQSVTTGVSDLTVSFSSEVEAVVPLPATLPLFATGLGALGLLGWRRKRKQAE
jgi:hypothetical protein